MWTASVNQGLIRTRATSSAAMERTATPCIETAHARTTAAYAEDQVCKRPAFRELAPGFTPNIVNHGAEKLASLPLTWSTL
jgi:hypothetical protein